MHSVMDPFVAQKYFPYQTKMVKSNVCLISLKGLKYIFTNFMVLIPLMMDVTCHVITPRLF